MNPYQLALLQPRERPTVYREIEFERFGALYLVHADATHVGDHVVADIRVLSAFRWSEDRQAWMPADLADVRVIEDVSPRLGAIRCPFTGATLNTCHALLIEPEDLPEAS